MKQFLFLLLGLCSTRFLHSEPFIKAIIFDCDGTLVDSEGAHFTAWEQTLQHHRPDLTLEKCLSYSGMSAPMIAQLLAKSIGSDCPEQILKEKKEHYQKLQEKGLTPIEGTVDFLKHIASQKEDLGLKIGLASAAEKSEILNNLKHLGIETLFDVILSGHDDLTEYTDPEGVNKPKPYIYLHAAKLLNVSPMECVVIEDSQTGIIASKTAGCFTIAVPNRFTNKQDLSFADMKIESLLRTSPEDFLKTVSKFALDKLSELE